MNTTEKIQHIKNCLFNGQHEQSKLEDRHMHIAGFSSRKIRHFLNNLLDMPNVNYLEIGTFQGSTFCSALYNNNVNSAYAIDNWSEFQDYGPIKELFLENSKGLKFELIEGDCFKIDLSSIKNKINVYLYDGRHFYQDQYKALTYYYPVMDDEFIFMVDDYDTFPMWEQVEKATKNAIKDLNLDILFEEHKRSIGRNNHDSWWNGYYVSLLRKKK